MLLDIYLAIQLYDGNDCDVWCWYMMLIDLRNVTFKATPEELFHPLLWRLHFLGRIRCEVEIKRTMNGNPQPEKNGSVCENENEW